jgi:hypothetical protein
LVFYYQEKRGLVPFVWTKEYIGRLAAASKDFEILVVLEGPAI